MSFKQKKLHINTEKCIFMQFFVYLHQQKNKLMFALLRVLLNVVGGIGLGWLGSDLSNENATAKQIALQNNQHPPSFFEVLLPWLSQFIWLILGVVGVYWWFTRNKSPKNKE